jgi:NAD(P)-dependent dehydrogenase (short-subunit alcohol dehydrogenase family)
LARILHRMELLDRVALVTGGGGAGTGRAVALRLAAEGAAVVVADIDAEGGGETVRRVEAAGGRAAFVRADVTAEADVAAMVEFAGEAFGGLDVLVNSAGGPAPLRFPDAPSEQWGRTLDLNLRGPMLAVQHALPAMRRRGGGAIVNIASIAGMGTLPNPQVEYSAAKAGLIRLTAVMQPVTARDGVRVNCVVPDWIATPETTAYSASLDAAERACRHVADPDRMTRPEEIAGAVARFIHDDSMAGRVLVCWCGTPWVLVAPGDVGYARSEVSPFPPTAAPSGPREGAG